MPHAVEILSYDAASGNTTVAFIDDGGTRPGCVGISEVSSSIDAPCWSRALVVDLSFDDGVDDDASSGWEASISREWAAPTYDYSYSYGAAQYAAMAHADYANLIGGNVNYLGDVGGGDNRYLVAFVDIVNASYLVWEVRGPR